MDLILASTSPHRRALLERLGHPFRSEPPGVEESGPEWESLDPRERAESLAVAKAEAVASRFPGAVVIGGDQVASLDGAVLGKPGTAEVAREQLARLSGRSHRLFTAIALHVRGRMPVHVDITTLTMRPLDPGEIARYVEADSPLDCAGSYRIESLGIALFESIESADQTAIVGMPLIALARMLREAGFPVP